MCNIQHALQCCIAPGGPLLKIPGEAGTSGSMLLDILEMGYLTLDLQNRHQLKITWQTLGQLQTGAGEFMVGTVIMSQTTVNN